MTAATEPFIQLVPGVTATLFYGIVLGAEDQTCVTTDMTTWLKNNGLDDHPQGIEVDISNAVTAPVPFIFSAPTAQAIRGCCARLEKWPPSPPPERHIAWLIKAADKLGWPRPDWHLATCFD